MSPLKVLVVDDNQDLADGLCMILEDEGYEVSTAYNGTDGLVAFSNNDFDLSILDIKLPDMSGIELFLKMHEKNPLAKVLMMTGFRIEQMLAEVAGDGDVRVFHKPFDLQHMPEVLKESKDGSLVLVAENKPGFSDDLSACLSDMNLTTVLARNSQAAVDAVLSGSIDVLVLDINKPVICGLEIYLKLKKQGTAVKTVIVAGALADDSEMVDIYRSPAITGCLFKPFNPKILFCSVESFINKNAA